jgi:hypothetical protein
MSEATAPPAPKVHKYRSLRDFPFVVKTLKFKQGSLMRDATSDDAGLLYLMQRFTQLRVPRSQFEYFLTDRGACSVFSVKWLAEVLGVMSGHSLRSANSGQRANAVRQSMAWNAALQFHPDDRFLRLLTSLHGVECVGRPVVLRDLTTIASHSGSYFIACDAGSYAGHAAHAIAFTSLYDGGFFDPNAGEYAFTVGTEPNQKMEFLSEWLRINVKDGYNYSSFTCYEVQRLP